MHTALIPAITTFCELRGKEVVNVIDGSLLGCISDIELNVCTGEIRALILPGGNGILACDIHLIIVLGGYKGGFAVICLVCPVGRVTVTYTDLTIVVCYITGYDNAFDIFGQLDCDAAQDLCGTKL